MNNDAIYLAMIMDILKGLEMAHAMSECNRIGLMSDAEYEKWVKEQLIPTITKIKSNGGPENGAKEDREA